MPPRPDETLVSSAEVRIGLALPSVLSARLDALVRAADSAGARTNRKEILSALLLDATDDPDALRDLVQRLRVAQVRDAAVAGEALDVLLQDEPGRPGPRPRTGPA